MKKYIYLLLMLPLLLLAACYEGSDLGELYDSNIYSTQIKHVEIKSIGSTYADIDFRLSCAKYDSEIKLYYTDKLNIDPYPNGSSITIAKIPRQDSIKEQFSAKLEKLNPDTKYRYVIVSTDPSGHTTISKENSFSTEYLQLDAEFYANSIYKLGVHLSFYNLPQDREIGFVIGSESTVTINHCLKNISLDEWGSGFSRNYILKELTPATDYYVRAYTITEGRVFYGKAAKGKTLNRNVLLNNLSVQLTNFSEARFECEVSIMRESYWYPEFDTYNEFNYGFELSQSASFENAKEYHIEPDYYNRMNHEINDLEPSTLYYLRAFADHDGDRVYSQTKQFKTRINRLCGDVDSLYIDDQWVYFSLVKAGTFMMGATPEQIAYARNDEYPAHEVTISEDFYISQKEITTESWDLPYRTSWEDAMAYARKLRLMFDFKIINLPTEAEWEYAARGGHLQPKQTLYAGSNILEKVAFVVKDTTDGLYMDSYDFLPFIDYTGRRAPNALGIYDMSGNAAEWTRDAYKSDYYSESPATDPVNALRNEEKTYVVRGGGAHTFKHYYTTSDYRVSARNYANYLENAFSFRITIRNK